MEFHFTYHARLRMGLRGISEDMIEQAVSNPDWTGAGYQGRLLAYKLFPGRGTMKVVFARRNGVAVIITAIWE